VFLGRLELWKGSVDELLEMGRGIAVDEWARILGRCHSHRWSTSSLQLAGHPSIVPVDRETVDRIRTWNRSRDIIVAPP